MRHIKSIVLITFATLLVITGFVYYFGTQKLPLAVSVNYEGHPTLGYPKAKVHLVLFEEPKCVNCSIFNDKIFPVIKKEFIDTNKITYTTIPVSFLPGSMPAAIALLCVYYANPDYPDDEMFYRFLDYMYAHQPEETVDWATEQRLMNFARKTSPAIETEKLKKCIEMQSYRVQIEKNTAYAEEVMGGVVATPTLYVNGIEVKEMTLDKIRKLIQEVLKSEGVY